jgi:hypothetical protein
VIDTGAGGRWKDGGSFFRQAPARSAERATANAKAGEILGPSLIALRILAPAAPGGPATGRDKIFYIAAAIFLL